MTLGDGTPDGAGGAIRRDDYGYSVRVLICDGCGAPFECSVGAGQAQCRHCGLARNVAARREAPELAHDGGAGEAARLEKLRKDAAAFEYALEEFTKCFSGGSPTEEGARTLQEAWTGSRRALSQGNGAERDAERLFAATRYLSSYHGVNDVRRSRALLESALEVLPSPRHRHVLLCLLASGAAFEGDFTSAEAWLRRCDDTPDDGLGDAEYRSARATLATLRDRPKEVLSIVGPDLQSVPMVSSRRMWCGILRANAHERLGDLAVAKEQLVHLMRRHPRIGARLQEFARFRLCERSYPAALEHQKAIEEHCYDVALRLWVCSHCGADAEVPPGSAARRCTYCGTITEAAPASLATEVVHADNRAVPGAADLTPARKQALAAQVDAANEVLPPDVAALCVDGCLRPDAVEKAEGLWRESLQRAQQGAKDLAERLYLLTVLLASALLVSDTATKRRRRALLDTAMQELPDAKYGLTLRCFISMAATRAGDLEAAAAWLGRCNPQSPDLACHSDYVLARAQLAAAKRDWQEVLRMLGDRWDATPLALSRVASASLIRAEALERIGRVDDAVKQLLPALRNRGMRGAMADMVAHRVDPQRWAASFPRALARVDSERARNRVLLLVIVILAAACAVYLLAR